MLIDHIAIEEGFSKHAYQAQCVVVDIGDEVCKFAHVEKQHPWFLAAVGGPMLKKGHMPIVHVVDVLTTKVYGNNYKDANHEDGDRSRGEDEENEEVLKDEENAEIDPMDMLFECAPDPLETPKTKSKPQRSSAPQRSQVRTIDMPEELNKMCACSSDPTPKHCGSKWIALIV